MPYLNTLTGNFSTFRGNEGGLNYQGKGKSADLILLDDERNETAVSIELFDLKEMETLESFQAAVEKNTIELYVNEWHTKKNGMQIFKYATEDQSAMLFTGHSNPEEELASVCHFGSYALADAINYLEEEAFERLLIKETKLDCQDALDLEGMTLEKFTLLQKNTTYPVECLLRSKFSLPELALLNKNRLSFYLKNYSKIIELCESGITHNELLKIDMKLLKKYFDKDHLVKGLQHLVTTKQLLHIDHRPPVLKQPEEEKSNLIYMGDSGRHDDFSYESGKNRLTITYHRENEEISMVIKEYCKNTISIRNLDEDNPNEILLHAWHTIPTKETDTQWHYSPELKEGVLVTIPSAFPLEEFKAHPYHTLLSQVKYYDEQHFLKILAERSLSVDDLKAVLATEKIELLCKNASSFDDLLKRGVSLRELSKADMKRLTAVFANYTSVEAASDFVDIKEILGLNYHVSILGLFSNAVSSAIQSVTDTARAAMNISR